MYWSLDEAVERLGSPGIDLDIGAARGTPVIVVTADADPLPVELLQLNELPIVAVGVGVAPGSEAFDVTTDDPQPVVDAVLANPQAAVTLVQLLRYSGALGTNHALVAESLAYSSLQSGEEHAAWLNSRGRRVRTPDPSPPILVEDHPNELRLTLNRPRLHNPFSAAMRDAMVDILRVAALDLRPVRLTAAGKSFCVGGDLAEFGTVADPATAHQIRMAANAAPWLAAVADRLTVELHGACVGAGIELAAFAGTISATPNTVIALPEVAMGLIPGAGGTVSIPRRIGRHRTAWMALTGSRIDAATAHAWGLIDRIDDTP